MKTRKRLNFIWTMDNFAIAKYKASIYFLWKFNESIRILRHAFLVNGLRPLVSWHQPTAYRISVTIVAHYMISDVQFSNIKDIFSTFIVRIGGKSSHQTSSRYYHLEYVSKVEQTWKNTTGNFIPPLDIFTGFFFLLKTWKKKHLTIEWLYKVPLSYRVKK